MESDEKKILAIETWATKHSKWDKPMPKIGLKYINDLLEYIEDMKFLTKQFTISKTTERIEKRVRKELEKELSMLEFRADDERISEDIYRKVQDHKMEFQDDLYKEENALLYLEVIPAKFIMKSLLKRIFWEEAE